MLESANPNTPVTTESHHVAKGDGPDFFEDIEEAPKEKAKAPAEKKEPKAKAEPKESSAPKKAEKKADVTGGGEEKAEKAKPDAKGKGDAEDDKGEAKDKEEKAKAKPKVHKARSGESTVDLSGDSVFSVPVDGKKTEVPLQDLIDNYSGKVFYDRKLSDLDVREKSYTKRVESLNSMVEGILKKANESPEEGLDFVADLVGKDPVEFKEQTLRKQIAELLPLAQMDEDEREAWIKDRVRDWRDRRYERRAEDEKKTKADAEAKVVSDQARAKYGISEEDYEAARQAAKTHLEGEEPTPEQVIYAERYLLGLRTLKEVVPKLESHPKFGNIVEDVAQQLLATPDLTKEQLAALLVEVYGSDEDEVAKVSKKVRRQADDERPANKPDPKRREQIFFDDDD